jgi:VanZ family protein
MTASRYRGSLAVWLLLLAYASLYPFYPWRPPPPDWAREFVAFSARYMIRSDIAFNVIAYVPLGTLACLYFRNQPGSRLPVTKSIALGAVFAFAMELAQLCIPNRVSSLVDIACNTAGALIGALAFLGPIYKNITQPLGEVRERVIISGAWGDAGLVLLMLWFLAQWNPALPFFGAGNVGVEGGADVSILQWVGVGLAICGFGLFVSALLQDPRGSLRATFVLLSVALWLKFVTASMLLQPHFSEEWLGMERVAGLAGGLAAFVPLRRLSRSLRIYLGLVTILAGALLAKIFGAYSATEELVRLFRWPHGQLGSFATLTRFLHELWPAAAIVFLIGLFFRERRLAAESKMEP